MVLTVTVSVVNPTNLVGIEPTTMLFVDVALLLSYMSMLNMESRYHMEGLAVDSSL